LDRRILKHPSLSLKHPKSVAKDNYIYVKIRNRNNYASKLIAVEKKIKMYLRELPFNSLFL